MRSLIEIELRAIDCILLYKFKIGEKWRRRVLRRQLAMHNWFRRFLWREVRVKDIQISGRMSTCRLVCVRPGAEKLGRRARMVAELACFKSLHFRA